MRSAKRARTSRFAAAPSPARRSDPERIPTTIQGRVTVDSTVVDDARRRVPRKLGKHAHMVERLTVRFAEAPREPSDLTICRIVATLCDAPAVIIEEEASDPALALRRAADTLGRTLQRAMRGVGHAAPAHTGAPHTGERAPGALATREDEGSVIGRRVGHARSNLERALDRPEKRRRDAFVDTARPGVSATDRTAGYGATAARNTRRNTAGMTYALEDSRTSPSRKSTRRSANRAKGATAKQRTTQLAAHSPRATAARARVRQPRADTTTDRRS